MGQTLTVTAQVEVPRVPNFLRMTDGQTIPVSAITDAELKRLAVAWGEDLVKNAKRQRESGTAKDERTVYL